MYMQGHTKINENYYRILLFTDLNTTDIIFTDIVIHAKVFSVKVMSVIILTDNVNSFIKTLHWSLQVH